jgi:CRISPR-associated protein Csy1
MTDSCSENNEVQAIRAAIDGFIKERWAPKRLALDKELEKADTPEKRNAVLEKQQKLTAAYGFDIWLLDAAKRAGQIKVVTHAVKYTNPSATGSSIYLTETNSQAREDYVGSHSKGKTRKDDVVGNAAALDVYKFLMIAINGKTILQRLAEEDPHMRLALNDDAETSGFLAGHFLGVVEASSNVASHSLAKQVFFPVGAGTDYQLLSPLFPTSLVHAVHQTLREDRFSENAKLARQARKNAKAHSHGYREYPNLAIQAFGGTKPQNISQLNSERYGENWLLPSLPPIWESPSVRQPLKTHSIFSRYLDYRKAIRDGFKDLASFLTSTDYNNMHIRKRRAALVNMIADEVIQLVAQIHTLPPGWTCEAECSLDTPEKLWLDPGRTALDDDFNTRRQVDPWREDIANRFANWMNRNIRQYTKRHGSLPVGDAEHSAWYRVFEDALPAIGEELDYA